MSGSIRDDHVVLALATIGVFGWTLESFLDALRSAGVEVVVDVRQRRGVRGSEYAWANAGRLQAAFAEAGIGYEHRVELAPTTELRQLQYGEDAKTGVGKRSRDRLASEYVRRYTAEVLDRVELVPPPAASALLCVERDPEACHRSLIAGRLAAEHGLPLAHLRPG
jgi:uncharacterized protein (DUF488 family)